MKENYIRAGEMAPDFVLKDHKDQEFRLSDFKGKRVLLSFHPLAWTSICAQQMQSLDRHWEDFRKLNTIAVGINVDSVPSKNFRFSGIFRVSSFIISVLSFFTKVAKFPFQ